MGFQWAEFIRGPNGDLRVKSKIRPKPVRFQVSKPENPWAVGTEQTPKLKPTDPKSAGIAPDLTHCHL
jgi:hypothetical protein